MTVAYESARLRLRQFTEEDAPRLFALDSDPEVQRYVHMPPPTSEVPYLEAIRGRYRRYYDETPGLGYWAAEERAGGAFVGWFHLRPALDYRFAAACGYRASDLDLGYRLRREVWGRGYATELARSLVGQAFAALDAARVVACALLANRASVRVLEKTGLTWQAEVRLPGIEPPAGVFAIDRPAA